MFLNDIGDFEVFDDQLDRARERQAERSEESRAQDRSKRAPVTTNVPTWKRNPDRYDFPGIDTPSENPGVLPKDLTDPAPTRTTSKVQGKAPIEPVERTERDYQRERLGSLDISLTPGEAFEGVGVVSSSELGGNVLGKGERAPTHEPKRPPESALKFRKSKEKETLASQKTRGSDIAFIYENTDTDLSLPQFNARVKSEKRRMGGMADDFAAADLVRQQLGKR